MAKKRVRQQIYFLTSSSSCCWIRDPGWKTRWIREPGWKKSGSGIRDKRPDSATLFGIKYKHKCLKVTIKVNLFFLVVLEYNICNQFKIFVLGLQVKYLEESFLITTVYLAGSQIINCLTNRSLKCELLAKRVRNLFGQSVL
jgi:hypothetical protein